MNPEKEISAEDFLDDKYCTKKLHDILPIPVNVVARLMEYYHTAKLNEVSGELPSDDKIDSAIMVKRIAQTVIAKLKEERDRYRSLYVDYSNELDHTKEESKKFKASLEEKEKEIAELKKSNKILRNNITTL